MLFRSEDHDPDTISFSTDRFSPYAIAYIDWNADAKGDAEPAEKTADNRKIVNVIIITFVIFIAGMVLLTLRHGRNRKNLH